MLQAYLCEASQGAAEAQLYVATTLRSGPDSHGHALSEVHFYKYRRNGHAYAKAWEVKDYSRDPAHPIEVKEFSIKDEPGYKSEKEFLDDYRDNGEHDAGETVEEFLKRRFCGGRGA